MKRFMGQAYMQKRTDSLRQNRLH